MKTTQSFIESELRNDQLEKDLCKAYNEDNKKLFLLTEIANTLSNKMNENGEDVTDGQILDEIVDLLKTEFDFNEKNNRFLIPF